MHTLRKFLFLLLLMSPFLANASAKDFIKQRDTHFYKGDARQPYYFVGTNLWYAPILASEGQGGDLPRLCHELDSLKNIGVDNLRILVGADAGSANVTSVAPVLQSKPGVLNDTLLAGLDRMLAELEKRDMYAVLYLTNSWDWSGGFGYYLRETGHGDSPDASGDGWSRYVDYAAEFFRDRQAQQLYFDFVKTIVGRTNGFTGKAYKDDAHIMAWQLCNEPRPFAKELGGAFVKWVSEAAALIKSIDPNHLVSTGSEGIIGCNVDEQLCERVHADRNIDYITVHIWPANWGWAKRGSLHSSLPHVFLKTEEYISAHDRMAQKLQKPFVIEEFGYPRDANAYSPAATTDSRNAFYGCIFQALTDSRAQNGALAGCNFWGWGGSGRARAERWTAGDDFLCDPPHEPQGWYSVFDTDRETIGLIRQTAKKLKD